MVLIFKSLFVKELKEAKIKFLVLLLSFVFLGLLELLLIYMLPELLPSGMEISLQFTAPQAFHSSIQDILQIGALIITLLSMDAVAGERDRNTLELLLIRPVSRATIIFSKFSSRTIIIFIAVFTAAFPTWGYTLYLFGDLSLRAALISAFTTTLLLVFTCVITITYSILVKSQYMAAIGGIVTVTVLASLTMLPEPWNAVTPFHYGNIPEILHGTITAASYLQNTLIITTFVVSVFLLNVAIFNKIYLE